VTADAIAAPEVPDAEPTDGPPVRKTTMGRTGLKGFWRDACEMEPQEDARRGPVGRFNRRVVTFVLLAVLHANLRLINRLCPDHPAIWPTDTWDWVPTVEAAFPAIRREMDAYIAESRAPLPHVAELAGLDLDTELGGRVVLNDKGAWRAVILYMKGQWIPETCERFPETTRIARSIPHVNSVGFTALDGHSHIEEHVGPNKGALRYQLPIIVPGQPGDCRIRILEEMVPWVEGQSLIFDLAVNHEAWNDSDELRVLLNFEVQTPLPFPLSLWNRGVQRLYRYHPSHRGQAQRMRDLHRRRSAVGAAPAPG
jgi:beta-hydroxylase